MKIALLGSKGTTLDFLRNLDFEIHRVITLGETPASINKVAYYKGGSIVEYCLQNNIDNRVLSSYKLDDSQHFEGIDLLLVIGWERLIPDKILQSLGMFACGMHGSPFGLPRGRGRSPLNWSLIGDHTQFVTYLFRYTPGMDDGDVIGFKVFEINPYDDIMSLHMKNRIAMNQLVTEYLPLIEEGDVVFTPQAPGMPTYYPKRAPDDGVIDWSAKSSDICRLVRAITYPYPSAITMHKKRQIYIDEAVPFSRLIFRSAPGTIVDISYSLVQFVVQCGDGSVLVRKSRGADITDLRIGDKLESLPMPCFADRYPEFVSDDAKEVK